MRKSFDYWRKSFKYWKWLFPPLYAIPSKLVENADTYYNDAVEWRLKVVDAVQEGIKTTLKTAGITVAIGLILMNMKK